MPATRMPRPGDVVYLGPAASVQFAGGRGFFFRVIRIHDRTTYQGWAWLDGYQLNQRREAVVRRSVFVQVAGLQPGSAWPARTASPVDGRVPLRNAPLSHGSRSARAPPMSDATGPLIIVLAMIPPGGSMYPTTAVPPRSVEDDPLYPAAGLLPLGRSPGAVIGDDAPSAPDRRPFGLRFAVAPTPVQVDLTTMRYDRERQVSVDDVGAPVYGKHSTGQTSTQTSDGHRSMDSDNDHTED